jgi:hypothetical protein
VTSLLEERGQPREEPLETIRAKRNGSTAWLETSWISPDFVPAR